MGSVTAGHAHKKEASGPEALGGGPVHSTAPPGGSPRSLAPLWSPLRGGVRPRRCLRTAVSHVEVDDVLGVSPLHRNGERLKGVEGEGNEAPHGVADGAAEQARLDLKLEQAGVAGVEPDGVISTGLGALHD